jgi:hypothetical protein
VTQTEIFIQADSRQAYSSAEVTKNTKGYSWSCKVYVPAGQEHRIMVTLRTLESELREAYGDSEE